MPLTTLHLLALSSNTTISKYLRALFSCSVKPLVTAKPIRWIIKPSKLSTHLLNQTWDLLLILPADKDIPKIYLGSDWIHRHWSIAAGVPSRIINGFEGRNERFLRPREGDVPALTGSLERRGDSQDLMLSDELLSWSRSAEAPTGAVSMLNLLSFKQEKDAHERYLVYGKAFAESIGAKRGGHAKVVGKIVSGQGTVGEVKYGWDEVALAHYPTIEHFTDMLGSEDYQEVNLKYRVPALRDTLILCTSELDSELSMDKAKL